MENIIAAVIILAIVGAAAGYVVSRKRKNKGCIGCPYCGGCNGSCNNEK